MSKERAVAAIEFYFDFASPFAYLAHARLPGIADRFALEIAYRPINLFDARLAAGNTGPSTPQVPPKFRYIRQDIQRWAKRYGIPFVFPPTDPSRPGGIRQDQVDSTRAHKAMFYANRQSQGRAFAQALWSRTYAVGSFIGDEANLLASGQAMGWQMTDMLTFIASPEADELYAEGQAHAHAQGVFGVPTMVLNGQMWWGNDRLEMLENHLSSTLGKEADNMNTMR